ncbi:MAG: hypothetical protein ACLFSL_00740 [Candidatus Woesearchaeota archaeon]
MGEVVMIIFWTSLTIIAILFLVISALILLFLHGHDKGREKARTLQIIALFLLVVNSSMLLISSAQFVDQLITTRLILMGTSAFLLALSFFLELKYVTETGHNISKSAKTTRRKTAGKSKKK